MSSFLAILRISGLSSLRFIFQLLQIICEVDFYLDSMKSYLNNGLVF